MFIQPCFIRKYSKELCEKLEKLGLEIVNSNNTTLDGHNYDGKGNHHKIEEGKAIITYYSSNYGVIYDIDYVTKLNRFDCETNEELFLAIASLRNDTDKNQWFIMDVDIYSDINKGDWFKATDIGEGFHIGTQIEPLYCHKATIKELIEHFKK